MTKIMLVEDDNNLREIYQARLAAEGYEIVSSSDGEAALAMAARERPDMIISDVMMPKISGFEMLDILRNTDALKNVKIIMLTALGQAEDSARADSLGADRYLVKSQVTLEDIVKATHDLLDPPAPDEGVYADAGLPAADGSADTATATSTAPIAEPDLTVTDPVAPVMPPEENTTPAEPVAVAPAPDPVVPEPTPETTEPTSPAESPTSSASPVTRIAVVEPDAVHEEPAAETQAEASLPVIEPPTDSSADDSQGDTSSPADDTTRAGDTPSTDDSAGSVSNDFTSPETFNNFQAPPTIPTEPVDAPPLDTSTSEAEVASSAPQSAADQEASIKAQIDSFINAQDAATPEPDSTADTPEAAAYVNQPTSDQLATEPSQESVDQPNVEPAPEETSEPSPTATENVAPEEEQTAQPADHTDDTPAASPWASVGDTSTGSATAPVVTEQIPLPDGVVEPEPEMFGTFGAPVISGADTASAQPVPVPAQAGPAPVEPVQEVPASAPADDSSHNDAVIAGAVANLSNSSDAMPAATAGQVFTPTAAPAAPTPPNAGQLAVQDARTAANLAAASPQINPANYTPSAATTPSPSPTGVPPVQPGSSVDPNSISL